MSEGDFLRVIWWSVAAIISVLVVARALIPLAVKWAALAIDRRHEEAVDSFARHQPSKVQPTYELFAAMSVSTARGLPAVRNQAKDPRPTALNYMHTFCEAFALPFNERTAGAYIDYELYGKAIVPEVVRSDE